MRISATAAAAAAADAAASAEAAAEIASPAASASSSSSPFTVEEFSLYGDSDGFEGARAQVTWDQIDAWANTTARLVVARGDLKRIFEFTSKIFLVRRADGELAGCALMSEAPMGPDAAVSEDICDSLNRRRNTMLPKVKTPKTGDDFIDFREVHVRGNFDASIGSVAIDELLLICGERGTGGAIMAHLRHRQRILFASVIPGSDRATAFYDKHFKKLNFEMMGATPYAAWLGAAGNGSPRERTPPQQAD